MMKKLIKVNFVFIALTFLSSSVVAEESTGLLTQNDLRAADKPILNSEKPKAKLKKRSNSTKPSRSTRRENYLLDASFSFNRGDYFRSIKLFELVKEKNPKDFMNSQEYSLYIRNLGKLGSISKIRRECNSLNIDKALYACAFVSYELGYNQLSNRYLKRIKKPSEISVLLQASNYLALKSPNQCIESIQKFEFSNGNLDLKSLSMARCFSLKRNYRQAIGYFKNVSSDSIHYMDSLYELAWSQFKDRNIGDTKSTIDVLLSSYTEFSEDRGDISQNEYFSLRYLRAYLGLVQSGASDVDQDLNLALQDLKSIKERIEFSDTELLKVLKDLNKTDKTWAGALEGNENLNAIVELFSNWGASFKNKKVIEAMKYQLALSFEKDSLKSYANATYAKQINTLHRLHLVKLEKDFIDAYRTTLQALNGFELRIQLAKQKKNVLAETDGLRNLEQAKQIYKEKENYINQLVGEIE